MARFAGVDRAAQCRAEAVLQSSVAASATWACGNLKQHHVHVTAMSHRRCQAKRFQLSTCLVTDPIARPGGSELRFRLDICRAQRGQPGADILLHDVQGGTASERWCD